jgi:hypothetical protein
VRRSPFGLAHDRYPLLRQEFGLRRAEGIRDADRHGPPGGTQLPNLEYECPFDARGLPRRLEIDGVPGAEIPVSEISAPPSIVNTKAVFSPSL